MNDTKFPELNLPYFKARLRKMGEKTEIFDIIRKKFVTMTPEEWVRQHFIHYLIDEKKTPSGLIRVESGLRLNNTSKRSDILVCDRNGKPLMIIECKAGYIKISQDTFDQIARYNMSLKVKYLVVTNGLQHFCCQINYEKKSYQFLKQIPDYHEIID